MSNLLVPIQTLDIICASCRSSEPEGILDIVQVRDEQLAVRSTGGQEVRVFGVELEGLNGTRVFRGS